MLRSSRTGSGSSSSPSLRTSAETERFGAPPQRQFAVTSDSRWPLIAEESRYAVVKILGQVIEFDFLQPFRRSDVGQAIGTGFFVDNNGTIVTNAHVVDGAHRVWITTPEFGEKRYKAEVLGVCFDLDLAMLRCSEVPVKKVLKLGASKDVRFGEQVLTLGYPLGMDSLKLTVGIVSGRQEGLFQTDAPLNPGNSGGPMLNGNGQVIGVNVSIVENSQNVGFAIPADRLKQIYDSLSSRPKDSLVLHQPILGMMYCNGSESLHKYLGHHGRTGVYVTRAFAGWPLYEAGVRDGDVLHKFNGYDLDDFGQAEVDWQTFARANLQELMSMMTYDMKPEIVYSRESELRTAKVDFVDPTDPSLPLLPKIREFHPPFERIDYEVIAGMVVMHLMTNHVEELVGQGGGHLEGLIPYAVSMEKQVKEVLLVSHVVIGSEMAKMDAISAGMVIRKVLDLPSALADDFELSSMYMFQPSSLIDQLVEKYPKEMAPVRLAQEEAVQAQGYGDMTIGDLVKGMMGQGLTLEDLEGEESGDADPSVISSSTGSLPPVGSDID